MIPVNIHILLSLLETRQLKEENRKKNLVGNGQHCSQ